MQSTHVFVVADTVEDARKLAQIFAESPDFVVSGFGAITTADQHQANSADVIVVRSRNSGRALISPFGENTPILHMGRPVIGNRGSNGVYAWLPADSSPAQIRGAAMALAAGLSLDDPSASPATIHEDESEFAFAEPLTEREIEVLNLVAEGLSNPEIARRLSVSRNTVKFHVSSIIGKLGASSRTEAVTLGLRRGLIII
jgi:DNA-binding CsgD family transcriptional regulator